MDLVAFKHIDEQIRIGFIQRDLIDKSVKEPDLRVLWINKGHFICPPLSFGLFQLRKECFMASGFNAKDYTANCAFPPHEYEARCLPVDLQLLSLSVGDVLCEIVFKNVLLHSAHSSCLLVPSFLETGPRIAMNKLKASNGGLKSGTTSYLKKLT
jgi:hypothetical protein